MAMKELRFADWSRVEEVDYGDGTGLRVEYDDNGNITAETPLTGLSIPQPNHVTFSKRFDTLPPEQADALWALISHPDLIPALTALLPNQGGSQ